MDYVGGYVIFNDITARDIQRREMRSGVFSFCKAIDTFCPLGPWIVTPDEIPDPHDLAMELRVNGESRQTSHSGRMSVTIPEILSHYSALGYSAGDVLSTGTVSGRRRLLGGRGVALPEAGRRDRGRDRADRRAAQPGDRLAGGARRAAAGARPVVVGPVVVGSVELVPLVDAVGELGELAELFPDTSDWEPYRELYPELFAELALARSRARPISSAPAATPCSSTPASGRPASGAGTPESEEGLLPALAAAGVAPEDVDVVFLTHLHVDHVGWNTDRDGPPRLPEGAVRRAPRRGRVRARRAGGRTSSGRSSPSSSRRSTARPRSPRASPRSRCPGTSPATWACGSTRRASARC